jgi:hypothetical protein
VLPALQLDPDHGLGLAIGLLVLAVPCTRRVSSESYGSLDEWVPSEDNAEDEE